jgi:SAM-dependent methyltransferase
MHQGSLDYTSQSHCEGWAVVDGAPAVLSVFVNDVHVADVSCSRDRPDLIAHGLPSGAGFFYAFPRPLRIEDQLDVRFRDAGSLPNSPSVQHRERLERLLIGIDRGARGLELGPLNRPILSKSDYDVRYVDHASTEDLRQKYGGGTDASVDIAGFETVDVVWSGGSLAAVAGRGYSYCLASHVIEHVPDPIGWLDEICAVLRPGGRINLAVPEQTRTFDYRRALTTPAAMLEAHHRKLQKPSFGQIFDHIAGVAPLAGPVPDPVPRVIEAYRVAQQAEARGDYMDVHCHVWTHDSFIQCWSAIDALGLLPLRIDRSDSASGAWNEFTASFVRL